MPPPSSMAEQQPRPQQLHQLRRAIRPAGEGEHDAVAPPARAPKKKGHVKKGAEGRVNSAAAFSKTGAELRRCNKSTLNGFQSRRALGFGKRAPPSVRLRSFGSRA